MMTKEEIAAFWKLEVALKPILDEDRENIPLTPELERALNEHSRLKELMRQEIDEIQAGGGASEGSSSSQQPQESSENGKMPSSMTLDAAYNVVGQAVGELVSLYKATINNATPEVKVKKFEDHTRVMVEALRIIGIELFAKPKIQQPQKS